MDARERDKIPILSALYFQSDDSTSRGFPTRNTSHVSMSNPTSSQEYSSSERQTSFVQMTGPLYVNHNRDFVFQPPQGALEQTITDPTRERRHPSIDPAENNIFHNVSCGDAKGWAKRMCSFLLPYIPGVIDPHKKGVHRWNKLFVSSCLIAGFIDPLFFLLLYVHQNNKCVVLSKPMMTTIVILRSVTDFIYWMHILLQFRLQAYDNPESRDMGADEDSVDDPRKIARNYIFGYFGIDFLNALPLPQVIILFILPRSLGIYRSNIAYTLLRVAILIQYVPRLYRFLPMLVGSSPTGFIFKSAWANFVINLLTFVLASHVVGSCWYLLGLLRVNRCFRNACDDSSINTARCREFIDCGHGNDYRRFENDSAWDLWKNNENATACFWKDGTFDFGIYQDAVNLTTHNSIVTRYLYSFFWGLQQISTLAGNQVPSYFTGEVLFTMAIIGVGLLLFALLIGNMQNFLQSLGRRKFEMLLRQRDVEQWMRRRCLPDELRSQVRAAERLNWTATRGVNEEILMENLPEDLQRKIRRHLFEFVRKVRVFQQLDEPIIDAICERLSTKTYIKGSEILSVGGLIDKMVFIIKGKMRSNGEYLIRLSKGDVCGEELLTWCLEHYSVNEDGTKIRIHGPKLLSNRQVRCSSDVEAFVLRVADLEEVASLYAGFLRSPRVQEVIRNESSSRRGVTARRFQVARRYRKKPIS